MTTTQPNRKAPCRAKDPSACPYHGAIIRMEAAAARGDLDGYFEARKKVEEAEAANWVDENPRFPIAEDRKDITVNDVRNALKEFQKKYDELFSSSYARNVFGSTEMDGFGRTLIDQISSYVPSQNKIILPKLGEVTILDSKVEGVTDGEDTWIVFEVGGHYYRLSGTYSSWDSHSWYNLDEVEPETKINTTVEHGYKII